MGSGRGSNPLRGGTCMATRLYVLILTISLLAINGVSAVDIPDEGVDHDTRALPLISGAITTNQTWSGEYELGWTTIMPNVTVNITAGSKIYPKAWIGLYVEGCLNILGEYGDHVVFGNPGGDRFYGISVNKTGKAMVMNCTFNNAVFGLGSQGTDLVIFDSKFIEVKSPIEWNGLNLIIVNCTIKTSVSVSTGIRIYNNNGLAHISDVSIDGNLFGVVINNRSNVIIKNLSVNEAYYGLWLGNGASNISTSDVYVTGTSQIPDASGICLEGSINETIIHNVTLESIEIGVHMVDVPDSEVTFTEVHFGDNVGNRIMMEGAPNSTFIFKNCTFPIRGPSGPIGVIEDKMQAGPTIYMNGNIGWPNRITFKGNGSAYMGYYSSVKVIDAKGSPIGCNMNMINRTIDEDVNISIGETGEITIPIIWEFQDRDNRFYLNHDYIFTTSDNSSNIYSIYNMSHPGQYFNVTIDSWPWNNFTQEMTMFEDEVKRIDLTDHFFDPEGEPMTFEVRSGPEIITSIFDGNLDIATKLENWYGESWFHIQGTDTGGNTTGVNVTLNIFPINDAPVILGPFPEVSTPEDTPVSFNLTQYGNDMEDDELSWYLISHPNCSASIDVSSRTLMIIPDEDWFGSTNISLLVSDGEANSSITDLTLVVSSVNDAPEIWINDPKGDLFPVVMYQLNQTVQIEVYMLEVLEDVPFPFLLNGSDIDDENLKFAFIPEETFNGNVKSNEFEFVDSSKYNTTLFEVSREIEYQTLKDNDQGDLARFLISDGEIDTLVWVWFNVTAVNDIPVLDVPDDWNITIKTGEEASIDLSEMIYDVDGDQVTITVSPSEFIIVDGFKLIFNFPTYLAGEVRVIIIQLSDGQADTFRTLRIFLSAIEGPDPEPEPEPEPEKIFIEDLNVIATEDGWVITASGPENVTIYIAVEDGSGGWNYYLMDNRDGILELLITGDDAQEGFSFFITDNDGGESLFPELESSFAELPKSDDGTEDEMEYWWLLLVALVLIIIVIVALMVVRRGRDDNDEWEE